ncbi:hypothetical protein BH11PAT4_BH11PAT4_5710 [soil metagenome]
MIEGTWYAQPIAIATVSAIVGAILAVLVLQAQLKRYFDDRLKNSKDKFIGLASHYLLTPITIIQTALSRLQESDSSLTMEQRHRLYDAIGMGQQRLWIIAEQLVLINEIDQNNLKPRLDVADFADVVGAAVSSMDIFARNKQVALMFENQVHEPVQGRMDARRIKQAVIAILDNAIKFSMEGTQVRAQISIEEDQFVLRVKDQGIGMPEEVLQHTGERFYRGSSIYEFDYEGLGLGLHIAQAIVTLHGGSVRFNSEPKLGTIATLQFPRT